jgi:hypothetical protein
MKTPISAMRTAAVSLLLLIGMLGLSTPAKAQDRFLLSLGSSFQDANDHLARYPQLSTTESSSTVLRVNNPYLEAEYHFESKGLQSLQVHRVFQSNRVAQASLDGYLIWLERAGATVIPQSVSKHYARYFAMTQTANYDLTLKMVGKERSIIVRSWKREPMELETPISIGRGLHAAN